MGETFRNMRSWGGLALGCAAVVVVPVGCAGTLLHVMVAHPKHTHSVLSAVFFVCVYVFMVEVCLWLLLDDWRGYVRIAGDRIISREAVETRDILFADVTELPWHRSGRVVLWAVNRWERDSTDVSVEKDMSVVFWTERGRFWRFALVWLFVGLMGTVVFGVLRERFLYPATVACVGAFAWAGVFVYESWLEGRVQARVDLEEAELAAKERGEVSTEMGR